MRTSTEIKEFVEKLGDEAHNDTWKYFRVGEKPSCDWEIAKAKEILCGEISRFINGVV